MENPHSDTAVDTCIPASLKTNAQGTYRLTLQEKKKKWNKVP